MSRPKRLSQVNGWFHVYNRGARKVDIFYDDDDRELFLRLLSGMVERFEVEIHAYCLLPNHYHLLLRTPHDNLSAAMKWFGGVYAQVFNRRWEESGNVFGGRFRSEIVDKEKYFLTVSRYIHLNPVKANLAEAPEKFPWSSCRYYFRRQRPPTWLSTDETFTTIGGPDPRAWYRRFVRNGLGGSDNAPWVAEEWVPQRPTSPLPKNRHIVEAPGHTLEEWFQATADAFDLELDVVVNGTRGRGQRSDARYMAIYLARKIGKFSYREIARYLDLSSPASIGVMLHRFEKRLSSDPQLEQLKAKLINGVRS